MRSIRYVHVLLLAVPLALACSSDDHGADRRGGERDADVDVRIDDAAGDADAAGDVRDVPTDAPDARFDGSDTDATDATGDAEQADARSDASDSEDVERIECDCPDSEAVCEPNNDTWWCVRPDVECEEDAECPDGYDCHYRGYCVCDREEPDDCLPRCEKSKDCAEFSYCDLDTNRCRPREDCSHNMECRHGERCVETTTGGKKCVPKGDREPGESCSEDYECSSGECDSERGECDRRCFKESDCPEGQGCPSHRMVCEEGEECEVDCPDGLCSTSKSCVRARCFHTGDCDEGNCVMRGTANYPEEGVCREVDEIACKDNEFQLDDALTVPVEPHCALPIRCSSDSDSCPEGYECLEDQFCARFADDDQ